MVYPFKSLEDFKVEITQDHELLRSAVRDFAENILSKYVEKGEKELDVPREVKTKAKEIGLYGLFVDPSLGGQGADYISLLVATEEITRVWPSFSTFLLIDWMFIYTLSRYGNEELKKKYIPPVAQGDKVAAFANTEPSAGTDVAGIKTTAKKLSNGDYVINGRKIFITNGDIADYYLITARTSPQDPKARWKGISMFIVEKDLIKPVSRIETTGLKASHTAEIVLEDVKVPAENLVGEESNGFKYAVSAFDFARTIVASQALGVGQAAFEKMVNYTLQRTAFDKKLAEFQLVQTKVSESLADLEMARLITYWAGTLFKNNRENEYVIAASLAKFISTEAAERIVLRAMSTYGGYGVTNSTGLERMLRDLQIMKTYEGTNDIQRISAARFLYNKFVGYKV
ncbi:acyl-CoA dehydrogenase [Sulfolobus sp. A20]|uniref:acyl-CoA dehydrogenase family protein n=1 Tax=Sulfolobaceae TaxID=118883 RepID=UPI000845D942|nr:MULTISPECIES: acyl-CoA dehydrogenase family protein [unclassified Sulfolobus]TRM74418.1 acyl-CoA dehydrogenase [Sulfolobus sp. E5]TRM76332.1 acyl-CoA dehydrogenase [Sulfolobus sp. A20-N-F8]TRM77538.1 acyl-CoA dehydrogenase [Sulfolobus sp. B5]TRM80830.1 acyl-CoA dehydrogenase [Sulfolobus sp. D5]TRM84302.1 acyl-CoA dehydrogenase [Sulfolobus sp. A20-N-F6]TRM89615.1 acyl-CoA dehydrogenase [Sulfolobus sp. C3]TRM89944.1 acyl-CoA dehydrogenase [Sulfolobus sp. A20-N-G8]TRM97888.1 acyl-CoA dehydr